MQRVTIVPAKPSVLGSLVYRNLGADVIFYARINRSKWNLPVLRQLRSIDRDQLSEITTPISHI